MRRASWLAATALAFLAGGCSSPPDRPRLEDAGAAGPPVHIVLVGIDTLRADFLSTYGFSHPSSPNIDELAREGVVFSHAVATAPWTLPSFASILTGEYPSAHGAGRRTGKQRAGGEPPKEGLRSSVPIVQQILQERAGFKTALFYNNPYLDPQWGLTRGFATTARTPQGGQQAVDQALQWIGQNRQEPTFLFLHLMEPHLPYEPPEPFRATAQGWLGLDEGAGAKAGEPKKGDRIRALYAGEVAYTDHLVGELVAGLRDLGLLDDTLLIVTSDHGEEFYEHEDIERERYNDPRKIWGIGHGHNQFQELLWVPLIIRAPGRVDAGTRIDAPVQGLDIAPSILEWAGLEPPETMSGAMSLLPVLRGDAPARDYAYSEFILYGDDRSAFQQDGWKIILGPQRLTSELYNLAKDPKEQRDLRAMRPVIFRRLARELLKVRSEAEALARAHPGEANQVEIDEKTREELRALGYVQ